MTTITNDNLNKAGVSRYEANSQRSLGALYGKVVSQFGDAHVVALYSALLKGEWTHDAVTKTLIAHEFNHTEYTVVLNDLREIGVLNQRGTAFTPEFVQEAVTTSEQMVHSAPARMLPLTVEPTAWTQPYNSDLNMDLVNHQATISRKDAHELYSYDRMPLVYQAVNKLQSVAFEVNPAIVPYLDRLTTSGMDHIQAGQIAIQKALIIKLSEAEKLHFYVTLDYRGRMYYRGGLLTPQGSDFQKAALRYSEEKIIGKSGYNALAVHFANLCGQDKQSLYQRIRWAKSDEGIAHAKAVMDGKIVHGKKEKFQALTASAEWIRIHLLLDVGYSVDEIGSKLICHQDGTCNGLQHGAALTGDRTTAINVNCTASTPEDEPADIYNVASNNFIGMIQKDTQLTALHAAIIKHNRNCMKLPIMVTGYGAGILAVMTDFIKVLKDKGETAALLEIDKHNALVEDTMKDTLAQTCGAMVTLTHALRKELEDNWDRAIQLETPYGFMMVQASENKENRRYAGKGEFQVRIDTPIIDESAQMKGISPNFVHTIDATHLVGVINESTASIVSVHDSVGSHACDYRMVNNTIRTKFVEIHEFDWVGSFNHHNGTNLHLRTGDYSAQEALASNYLFS